MSSFLLECNGRANRPYLVNLFMRGRNAAYTSNIEYMRGVAEKSEYPLCLSIAEGVYLHLPGLTTCRVRELSRSFPCQTGPSIERLISPTDEALEG